MYVYASVHELVNLAVYFDGPACVLVANPWNARARYDVWFAGGSVRCGVIWPDRPVRRFDL